jgi:hypothetical protein
MYCAAIDVVPECECPPDILGCSSSPCCSRGAAGGNRARSTRSSHYTGWNPMGQAGSGRVRQGQAGTGRDRQRQAGSGMKRRGSRGEKVSIKSNHITPHHMIYEVTKQRLRRQNVVQHVVRDRDYKGLESVMTASVVCLVPLIQCPTLQLFRWSSTEGRFLECSHRRRSPERGR